MTAFASDTTRRASSGENVTISEASAILARRLACNSYLNPLIYTKASPEPISDVQAYCASPINEPEVGVDHGLQLPRQQGWYGDSLVQNIAELTLGTPAEDGAAGRNANGAESWDRPTVSLQM